MIKPLSKNPPGMGMGLTMEAAPSTLRMLKTLLPTIGIHEDRLRLRWVSASEGNKFASEIDDYVETIRKLGPNDIGRYSHD